MIEEKAEHASNLAYKGIKAQMKWNVRLQILRHKTDG
jgi:hypothetical protein